MKNFFSNIVKKRKPLYLWSLWFFLANAVIFWIVGYKLVATLYPLSLPFAKPAGVVLVKVFIVISYLAHFALLNFLICVLLVYPLITLFNKAKLIIPAAVLIATVAALWLVADGHVYVLYRFHLNSTIFHMIFGGHADEVFELSSLEWLMGAGLFVVLLIVESIIAWLLWSKFILKQRNNYGKSIFITLAIAIFCSYYTVMYSLGTTLNVYSQQVKAFPFYTNFIGFLLSPAPNGYARVERFGETQFTQIKQATAKLNYPIHPLQCKKPRQPLNIVFVVIDTWRATSLNKSVMPHTMQFAEKNWQFKHHYSGGNATQPGIFSLFYAISSNYWSSVLDQKKAPVFLDLLQQYGYQLGIYASAELEIPAFNKTVFQNIKNLRVETPGDIPAEKDRYVTKESQQFLQQHKKTKKPFFLFLFYDTAHGYCRHQDFSKPFQPAIKRCNRILFSNKTNPIPYLNRYRNALHFVDTQVGEVLEQLKQQGLMKNTVVVITGDHGEEFNDTHRNYWEHASNFTKYQVGTPLLIHWPGKSAKQFNYVTSHYDIVPTLMKKLFACQNPYQDYSLGKGLLNSTDRPYLLVGSYINFGIIEPERITIMYPSGNFQVEDLQAKPLSSTQPHYGVIRNVLRDMRLFYQENSTNGAKRTASH